jgi:membrane fusion protein, multidrug efflux system
VTPRSVRRVGSGDAVPDKDRAGRRRRKRAIAGAAFLTAAVAVAAIVALQASSSSPRGTDTALPPGLTTTVVTRRTLTESATVEGTLGYGGTSELYDRLAGTFTWLPGVGKVIRRGGTLFRIDNRQVALMYGSVPAYRTLKEGVSDGPDVAELNENLIDLGFDPYGAISDRGEFGDATAAAVRRWQGSEGLPETGKVELGRVAFAPGAQRVTAVHVSLGEDPPGGSGSKGSAGTEPEAKEPSGEKTDSKEDSKDSSGPKESAAKKPSGESEGKRSGEAAAAPMAVLGTTSTRQLVQLKLKASQQELAQVGEPAPVTLPNGSVVHGHLTNVGTVAESGESEKSKSGGGEGGSEEPTISVTLALDHPVAHLDKAPVSVELVKSVRRGVLAVSAAALVATAGGGYAVEALKDGRRVELAVTPGMFTDGYVQIEGRGVYAGLKITEPAE